MNGVRKATFIVIHNNISLLPAVLPILGGFRPSATLFLYLLLLYLNRGRGASERVWGLERHLEVCSSPHAQPEAALALPDRWL